MSGQGLAAMGRHHKYKIKRSGGLQTSQTLGSVWRRVPWAASVYARHRQAVRKQVVVMWKVAVTSGDHRHGHEMSPLINECSSLIPGGIK
jgi:hypothetical protein